MSRRSLESYTAAVALMREHGEVEERPYNLDDGVPYLYATLTIRSDAGLDPVMHKILPTVKATRGYLTAVCLGGERWNVSLHVSRDLTPEEIAAARVAA